MLSKVHATVAGCTKADLEAGCSKYPGRLLEILHQGRLAPQKTLNLHVSQIPWGIVRALEFEVTCPRK